MNDSVSRLEIHLVSKPTVRVSDWNDCPFLYIFGNLREVMAIATEADAEADPVNRYLYRLHANAAYCGFAVAPVEGCAA
jgi:hypothetical protein